MITQTKRMSDNAKKATMALAQTHTQIGRSVHSYPSRASFDAEGSTMSGSGSNVESVTSVSSSMVVS